MIVNSGARQMSESEIEILVREFETHSLPPEEFGHRQHLAVAIWYLQHSASIAEAEERMRSGLIRFLEHHRDPAAYHETITLFWLKRLRSLLAEQQQQQQDGVTTSRGRLAPAVLELCGDPLVIFDYYSRGLLASPEAKAGWVEPDLRPLNF